MFRFHSFQGSTLQIQGLFFCWMIICQNDKKGWAGFNTQKILGDYDFLMVLDLQGTRIQIHICWLTKKGIRKSLLGVIASWIIPIKGGKHSAKERKPWKPEATRWAPTSYKWSYNQPYRWVTVVLTPANGVITLLLIGRGPPCMCNPCLMQKDTIIRKQKFSLEVQLTKQSARSLGCSIRSGFPILPRALEVKDH